MRFLNENIKDQLSIWIKWKTKNLIPGAPIGTNVYPIGGNGERDNRCNENQNSQYSKVSLRNF